MVVPSLGNNSTSLRLGARKGSRQGNKKVPLEALVGIGVGVVFACMFVLLWTLGGPDVSAQTRAAAHKRPIPKMGNTQNAVANDIITSLDCETFTFGGSPYPPRNEKKDNNSFDNNNANNIEASAKAGWGRRRRLADTLVDDINFSGEDPDTNNILGGEGAGEYEGGMMDDFVARPGYDYTPPVRVSGRELFCLVAGSEKVVAKHQEAAAKEGGDGVASSSSTGLQCDAMSTRREALLNVWSSARSQMTLDMIKNVLDLAVEKPYNMGTDTVRHLWAPLQDDSLEYYLEGVTGENSSIKNLDALQGKGGLFVDVGSGLGGSTLAVSLLYPEATVLSVEPAMPSWLLQRVNLVCNLEPDSKMPHPIMSGVGPKNDGMLKMMWRPASTGATRSWTPHDEKTSDDIELIVRLRTLRSILAEAAADEDIDADAPSSVVLNIDCEGCEYNIIPAMSDVEFDAIDTIVGTTGVHWGYIPEDKRPSSKRGSKTHERLCTHYDFARQAIECCAFPDLKVRRPGHPTVSELNGDLCSTFDVWAEEKKLYTSTDDYGWTELTSMA
mmetsp:Transcript_7431/g.10538  ORF Transcript_7431/g.10538 Transcript_7431/m.10538 type:complete len:555 (-) Transcript_7431:160-1824(-)